MKNIKVELLHSTPIKVLKKACEKPYKSEFNDNTFEKVAFNIINNKKHESVAEHINFSFDILGISRLCLQELARHRIASYTVESTRFTLKKFIKHFEHISLDKICEEYFNMPFYAETDNSYKENLINRVNIFYMNLRDNEELSNDYLKYFLPENYRVNLTMTINIRSLFNFLTVRLGNENNKPHFEIKYLAKLMLDQVLVTEYRFLFERFVK